jgi:hypothetical protein
MEPTEEGSVARKVEVSETGEVPELPTYTNVVEETYREAVKLLELHGKIPKEPLTYCHECFDKVIER